MKEIKEEITEDKNSLVEEEKELLFLIQMDKLQKKLENEKKKRGSLLERIDQAWQFKEGNARNT